MDADTEFYLLELRVGNDTLASALPALTRNQTLHLSLNDFLVASELAVSELEKNRWSGWAFSPERQIEIDLNHNAVSLMGVRHPIDEQDVIFHDEDIYVSAQQLAFWFTLTLTPDLSIQRLYARAEAPFAFQLRAQREARVMYRGSEGAETVQHVSDQYRWWTPPRMHMFSDIKRIHKGGQQFNSQALNLTASFDLLKHHAFFAGQFNRSDNTSRSARRLSVERRAQHPGGELFLKANAYKAGDLFISTDGLAGASGSGRGVVISRQHNTNNLTEGTVIIQGDAPPGWDVELYKSGQLLAISQVNPAGRYVFPDQPTSMGRNQFEVRVFGPQGQIETQPHIVWGGGVNLSEGEFSYRLGQVNFAKDWLNGDKDNGHLLPARQTRMAELQLGLGQGMQIGMSYYDIDTQRPDYAPETKADGPFSQEKYMSLELRADLFSGVVYAEGMRQANAGHAAAFGYQGNVNEHFFNLSQQYFDAGFFSPLKTQLSDVRAQRRFSLSGPGVSWVDQYQLSLQQDQLKRGGSRLEGTLRLGKQLQQLYLTNTLHYQGISGISERWRGTLQGAARLDGMSISASLGYRMKQEAGLDYADVTLRWRPVSVVFARSQLSKHFSSSRAWYLQQSFTWQHPRADLSANLSLGADDYWSIGFSISASLGEGWQTSRRNLTHYGRIKLSPFIDTDGNGQWGADEIAVPGATYKGPAAMGHGLGYRDIPGFSSVKLPTRHLQLPDLYMMPSVDAYQVYTHPASVLELDVPVLITGDIEGSVMLKGSDQGVKDIQVELLDDDNKVIFSATTEFDGYFAFLSVPSGHYRVRYNIKDQQDVLLGERFFLDPDEGFAALPTLWLDTDP